MSGSAVILFGLSVASTFDYTWISETAWAGGANWMTFILLAAGIMVWIIDSTVKEER